MTFGIKNCLPCLANSSTTSASEPSASAQAGSPMLSIYPNESEGSGTHIVANMSPDTLAKYADSETPLHRRKAAENHDTPTDNLEKLATDSVEAVRLAVANNPATPRATLTKLKDDDAVQAVRIAAEKTLQKQSDFDRGLTTQTSRRDYTTTTNTHNG